MNRTRPLLAGVAALALLTMIAAGCGNAGGDTAGGGSTIDASGGGVREQAVAFSRCMRDNGMSEFPDPDASGELTIDEVSNRAGLDTSTAAFEQALRTCQDLAPPGFTGHGRSADEQDAALAFARCIRDNGVPDFPDPTPDAPLVDTNRIPSSASSGGMAKLNAAMKRCGELVADQLDR